MGTLPRDGAANGRRLTRIRRNATLNGADEEVGSAIPIMASRGASVETLFSWRNDATGNGNEGETELLSSDATETQSDGGARMEGEETKEEEERVELVVSEDAESQSETEVELALVGDELVEVGRTRLKRGERSARARRDGEASVDGRLDCCAHEAIDAAVDERLLRAVEAYEEEFADASIATTCVWEAIAVRCGRGRFASGEVAQERVEWLQRVCFDESHPWHGDLTEGLRTLLRQYDHTAKTTVDATDPTLKSTSDHCAMEKQLVEKLAVVCGRVGCDEKDVVVFPIAPRAKRRQPNINAALEADVMSIVLQFAPQFASAQAKISVWDVIAENSRGRYDTGESARARTAWLCKVLNDQYHGQHAAITPGLRDKLLQYLELDPTATQKMSRARHQCLYGKTTEYRHAKAPKTVDETDELFMALVVEKWPFGLIGVQRKRVWAEIAEAVGNLSILDGRKGRERVDFLAKVFKDPSHDEHKRLTTNLRLSLSMYEDAKNEHDAPKGIDWVESSDASDATYEDSDSKDSSQLTPTETEIDALLREILRVRPFHAPAGKSMGEWQKIMITLRCLLHGKRVFPTAQSCLQHMKRLLRIARAPQLVSATNLPVQQRKMLHMIDRLLGIRWPKPEEELTAKYRALQSQIDELLNESQVKETQTEDRRPIRRVSMQNSNAGDLGEETGSEFVEDSSDSNMNADELDAEGRKRKRGDVSGRLSLAKRHEHPPRDAATHSSEIKTLYTEVAMCRAQMTLQSSSFMNERREHRVEMKSMIEMLKQERAANGHATATMLEIVRQEQGDRRLAFDAMMQLVTRSLLPARE